MAQRRKRRNGHGHQPSLESLQEDLSLLQANMSKLIAGLGGAASNGMSSAMSAASHAAEDAIEQAESMGQEGVETVRETIRAQPLAAIAISMGAGALLGAFLTRH